MSKIFGVAVSLSRARQPHTHPMADTYAWIFTDYTWKHTYTPAVAAVIAAAALSAGAATAAAIPMAGAVAHPSTLNKTEPGDRRVKVLGILNPSNNPLNTLKRVSGRSHPSLDKSLIVTIFRYHVYRFVVCTSY